MNEIESIWQLAPLLPDQGTLLTLSDQPKTLGRSQENQVVSIYISRKHCELVVQGGKVALSAYKAVFLRKGAQLRIQEVNQGETVNLDAGDIFYLSREGLSYSYGYLLKHAPQTQDDGMNNFGLKNAKKCSNKQLRKSKSKVQEEKIPVQPSSNINLQQKRVQQTTSKSKAQVVQQNVVSQQATKFKKNKKLHLQYKRQSDRLKNQTKNVFNSIPHTEQIEEDPCKQSIQVKSPQPQILKSQQDVVQQLDVEQQLEANNLENQTSKEKNLIPHTSKFATCKHGIQVKSPQSEMLKKQQNSTQLQQLENQKIQTNSAQNSISHTSPAQSQQQKIRKKKKATHSEKLKRQLDGEYQQQVVQQQMQTALNGDLKREIFAGLKFVFWVHEHVSILKKRIVEQAGSVCSELSSEISMVVCANNLVVLNKNQKTVLEQFPGIQVVKICYMTDCLERKRLLDVQNYLVWPQHEVCLDKVRGNSKIVWAQDSQDDPSNINTLLEEQVQLDVQMVEDFIPLESQLPLDLVAKNEQQISNSPSNGKRKLEHTQIQSESQPSSKRRSRLFSMKTESNFKEDLVLCEEPYDEQAALETVEKLKMHWYKVKPQAVVLHKEGSSKEIELQKTGCCTHRACSQLNTCIVSQLQQTRDNYKKNQDQFRIRAINKGIKTIKNLEFALTGESQVDELCDAPYSLGPKTVDKIREIVGTGQLVRNQEIANDPKQVVTQLLSNIWGVGESTAEKWYSQGCHSLEDVQKRDDLSLQQKVGVKYYADFQNRIPRAEVEMTEQAICSVIFKVLQVPKEHLFARALGSYIRGKESSGDVDILVVLPDYMQQSCCSYILKQILVGLVEEGMISEDIPIDGNHSGKHENASWLGVGRPVNNPYVRRIDIKVYPHQMKPFAVNYFIGDEYFNRALRYYCNTPTAEVRSLAKAAHPDATCFKLSDHGMYPSVLNPQRKANERHIPIAPTMQFKDETSIFQAVGLHYVPPHMRNMKT